MRFTQTTILAGFHLKIQRAFVRFPLVIAASILATATILIGVFTDPPMPEFWLIIKFIIVCLFAGLGILSIDLYGEKNGISALKKFSLYLCIFAFVGFYYFFCLPLDVNQYYFSLSLRTVLSSLGLIILNFTLPVIKDTNDKYWQYTQKIINLLSLAITFSAILFIGTTFILGAINYLFAINVSWKVYVTLVTLSFGIFGICFFLGNIPEDFSQLNQSIPNVWKFLAKYILLPLHTLYALILYAYTLQIFLLWNWPKGGVAYQILGFALAGIGIFLLTYPIRDQKENRLVQFFNQYFFKYLAPLLIVLFCAIGIRVAEFGITENRYFVLLSGIWLTFLCCFFIFSKNQKLKIIPISLCLAIFLSSFGPWNVFAVSFASQVGRLKTLAQKNQMWTGEKLNTLKNRANPQDEKEIVSIIRYINKNFGLSKIQSLVDLDVSKSTTDNSYEQENKLLTSLSLNSNTDLENKQTTQYFTFANTANQKETYYSIRDFDYFLPFFERFQNFENVVINPPGSSTVYVISETTNKKTITIKENGHTIEEIQLEPLVRKLLSIYSMSEYHLPKSAMTIETETDQLKIQLYLTSISARLNKLDNTLSLENTSGYLFLKIKSL